ncbi:MAG: hypothetical protein HYX85_02660 [Chloroflexi bacterium]|nr:hypothetical protein [Chloroflexota bacterium]
MAKRRALCLFGVSLLLAAQSFAFPPALAAPEELKWSPVNIPADGKTGHWQLADGSDVELLTMASDGALYAHARPSSTNYTLFKSTDGGYRWSYTGQVTDNIVALAVMPGDAGSVYYATTSTIHRSSDGGKSFNMIAVGPGGAGSGNVAITSLVVGMLGDRRIIVVGTEDRDTGQYGGVYIADESRLFGGWVNTGIGGYDALAVGFSPGYARDRLLVAVAANETDTLVATRHGDMEWGALSGNVTINGTASRKARIVFPPDFDSSSGKPVLFLGLDTGSGGGDIYRLELRRAPERSRVTDLNAASADGQAGIDIAGLAVSGNMSGYHLLAGAATSNKVYISDDDGKTWSTSLKDPSGQSKTYLLAAPDFPQSDKAYAATSGAGRAFSYTVDGGATWNQLGLIDTRLSEIVGLGVSPDYGRDRPLFMLTWGGEHSVWRSLDGGETWERVFSGGLAGAAVLSGLEVSPTYGGASQTLFLTGRSGSQWSIWRSEDSGQTFTRRPALFPIDVLVAASDNIVFVGSYNGTASLVYASANGGFFYSTPAAAGTSRLKSIALSPDYAKDATVLVGNTAGRVYLSADNGTSFEQLPPGASAAPFSGNVFVAFAPEFSRSRIVYAVSDAVATTASKQRVYRFTVGKSSDWENIDSTLPVGSILNRPVISPDGVIYVANAMTNGGMERSLAPSSLNPSFETVTRGLTDNATLNGLWLPGDRLFAVDTKNTLLMTFIDSATGLVTLTSPADKVQGVGVNNVRLDWQSIKGVTRYEWQVDDDSNFAVTDSGFQGETDGSSTPLPPLRAATTYYWRVRATQPVLSPWSEKRSFSTMLAGTVDGIELYNPQAGVARMPRQPVFQWSAVSGAQRYELMVSANVSFSESTIAKVGDDSLPETAWKSDVALEYDTTYYWKVRGVGAGSQSAWSATGVFTTEKAPQSEESVQPAVPQALSAQPPSPMPAVPLPLLISPQPPQPPATQPGLLSWTLYAGIALLGVIVGLLVAILVLLAKRDR